MRALYLLSEICIHLGLLMLPFNIDAQNLFDGEQAPKHINFTRYKVQDGLSSNIITALHQDHNGFLWVGTVNGLNRFDGHQFKRYYADYPDFKQSLGDGWINTIDEYNRCLYIGTLRGISKFNLTSERFEDIPSTNDPFYKYHATNVGVFFANNVCMIITDSTFEVLDAQFKSIYFKNAAHKINSYYRYYFAMIRPAVINKHQVLINTADGIAYYDTKQNQLYDRANNPSHFYLYPAGNPFTFTGKGNDSIYAVGEWANNLILCNLFNKKNDTIIVSNSQSEESKQATIYDILTLGKHIFIAASGIGLFYYNMATKSKELYTFNDETGTSASSNNLQTLLIDRNQTLWVGSSEGLYKINQSNNAFDNNLFRRLGLDSRYCNHILKNNKYELLFCFDHVDSLYFFNNAVDKRLMAYKIDKGGKDILYALQLNTNEYLFTTWKGIYHFNRQTKRTSLCHFLPDSLMKFRSTVMYKDHSNNLWIGLAGGFGLYRYNLNTKQTKLFSRYNYSPADKRYLPIRNVAGLVELDDGRIALYNNQVDSKLCLWDPATDDIQIVHARNRIKDYEPYHGTALAITKDKHGNLWLATLNGLIRFNVKDSMYEQFGIKEGLTNSNVSALSIDKLGNLWIGTYQGLFCLNTATKNIQHMEKDKIIQNAIIDYSYYDSTSNHIYLTIQTGFIDVDIGKLFVNRLSSNTYVNEVFVNQHRIDTGATHDFAHTECNFQFNVGSINLIDGAGNTYYYQLWPSDTSWKMLGKQTQINFANLSAGEFVFKVKSQNADKVWGSESHYRFIIHPAFYNTWWFRLLMVLFIAGLIYLIFDYRLKQLKRVERIRNKLSRDLHDDIGSTLSSINILSQTAQRNAQMADHEKTRSILEKIHERSQRLLSNMSDIIWNINPNNDSLEELISRMREYATTILEAKNIEYIFNFPNAVNNKLSLELKSNLYLIFKEAVNNLSKYSSCTKASISLSINEKNIYLQIKDNGKGFDINSIHHKGGLLNMQHRAEEIKATLNIISELGKGTQIELNIQFRN